MIEPSSDKVADMDKNLVSIDISTPSPGESAVLDKIRKREIELKAELLKTRRLGDALISDARAKAADLANQAKSLEEGTNSIYEKKMDEAKKKSHAIEVAGAKSKDKVLAKGRRNFNQAVEFVIQSVLPSAKLRTEDKNAVGDD